jgi:hypothetical protein
LAKIRNNQSFETFKCLISVIAQRELPIQVFTDEQVKQHLYEVITEPDIFIEYRTKFTSKEVVLRRYYSLFNSDTRYQETHLYASISMFIRRDVIQSITIHQIQPNASYVLEASRAHSLQQIKTLPALNVSKFVFEPNYPKALHESILYPPFRIWKSTWVDLCAQNPNSGTRNLADSGT